MNKKSRKLALDTETLLPLQADDVNKVHGGQLSSLPTSLPTLTTTLTTTSSLPTTSRPSWNGGGSQ